MCNLDTAIENKGIEIGEKKKAKDWQHVERNTE